MRVELRLLLLSVIVDILLVQIDEPHQLLMHFFGILGYPLFPFLRRSAVS
jgi:hypothetical protein